MKAYKGAPPGTVGPVASESIPRDYNSRGFPLNSRQTPVGAGKEGRRRRAAVRFTALRDRSFSPHQQDYLWYIVSVQETTVDLIN